MKRAAIYNRCSTEEEAQMNALTIQAAESREIVKNKGWLLVEQYIESESGTTIHKRSEYQRLLEDLETDKFDIVVIKSIDRLMRSAKDWYIFIDRITQNQKLLYIYIDDRFYTPDDSLLTGIKAILAEDFSRELSKKIKNAHRRRQNKKSGLNITVPMFGWNKIRRDVYEINEEEAKAYRLAFALAKEGKGFYTIANIMYKNGVRGKNGNRISDVQWRKMLYSPRAHGTVVIHRSEYDFEAKKVTSVPQSEWVYIENALPPIISEAYHKEVLEVMMQRATGSFIRGKGNASALLYDFSGKICCGKCNAFYYRTSYRCGQGKVAEWKCSTALKNGRSREENETGCNNKNLREDYLLEIIEKACKKYYKALFGEEKKLLEEVMAVLKKGIAGKDYEREMMSLERELYRIKTKKKVLLQKLTDEVIEDEDFKIMNRELAEKMETLQKKMEELKEQEAGYENVTVRLKKIEDALKNGMIERAETRELIHRIDKIYVYEDGRLELVFDKVRMTDLSKIYHGDWQEETDGKVKIQIRYEYKRNVEKKREQIGNEILKLLYKNPNMMLKEMPKILGVSESYIHMIVKGLKEQGYLRYKRGTKQNKGMWMVNSTFYKNL